MSIFQHVNNSIILYVDLINFTLPPNKKQRLHDVSGRMAHLKTFLICNSISLTLKNSTSVTHALLGMDLTITKPCQLRYEASTLSRAFIHYLRASFHFSVQFGK